jgi:hypothetical protein
VEFQVSTWLLADLSWASSLPHTLILGSRSQRVGGQMGEGKSHVSTPDAPSQVISLWEKVARDVLWSKKALACTDSNETEGWSLSSHTLPLRSSCLASLGYWSHSLEVWTPMPCVHCFCPGLYPSFPYHHVLLLLAALGCAQCIIEVCQERREAGVGSRLQPRPQACREEAFLIILPHVLLPEILGQMTQIQITTSERMVQGGTEVQKLPHLGKSS